MAKWIVYFPNKTRKREERSRDRYERRQRESGQIMIAGYPPGQHHVFADEMRVEGGALVFISEGKITAVFAPTAYERVYRHPE